MDNLEAGSFITPKNCSMSLIACLSFPGFVFEDNIRGLEDANRERVRSVLPNCFQEAGKERSADNLKFKCFRICNSDSLCTVVFMINPGEVLFVRALGIKMTLVS